MQLNFSYHNTNEETGIQLGKSEIKCVHQEELIYRTFKVFQRLTPSDLLTGFPKYPLTSIRRAITNLTKKGLLIKTQEMSIGIYGKNEHFWKFKN